MAKIEYRSLRKVFDGGAVAVEDLDLEIEAGEGAGFAVALLQTFGEYGGFAVCHAPPFVGGCIW